MYAFEFDAAKSDSNRTKHGIDFVDAQVLWSDPMLLEIGSMPFSVEFDISGTCVPALQPAASPAAAGCSANA